MAIPHRMPVARLDDIIVQQMDDECLVYDLNSDKALCLNTISAEIWRRCDGISTVQDVAEVIGNQMNIKLGEDFIWLAIDDLKKNKLLAENTNRPTEFENLSRRKVLFKYALPSLMLPVIASIVAPTAVNAQSGAPACNAAGFIITSSSFVCPGVGNPPTANAGCCSGFQMIVLGTPPNCNVVCN